MWSTATSWPTRGGLIWQLDNIEGLVNGPRSLSCATPRALSHKEDGKLLLRQVPRRLRRLLLAHRAWHRLEVGGSDLAGLHAATRAFFLGWRNWRYLGTALACSGLRPEAYEGFRMKLPVAEDAA